MAPDQEMQVIAAILHAGDLEIPRKIGITSEYLEFSPAQLALGVIYQYADAPETLGKVPAAAYLQAHSVKMLADYNPAVGTLEALCQAVKLDFTKRLLSKYISEISSLVSTQPTLALEKALGLATDPKLSGLYIAGVSTTLASEFDSLVTNYEQTGDLDGLVGLPTPFPTLTHNIKGWQKGELYVIYGPPKNYKSYVALAAVVTLFLQGYRTLIVSSEMTHKQLNDRMLCMILGLDFNQYLDRKIPSDTWEGVKAESAYFKSRLKSDVHHFTPTRFGVDAVHEVRAKIQELNKDGKLALVLWDGHYRSATSEKWEDVYQLVRRTRALALEEATGQVPILVTTQEGSTKGQVGQKAYAHEAAVIFYLEKRQIGLASMVVQGIRQGRGCEIGVAVNLTTSKVYEVSAKTEDVEGAAGGGLSGGYG